MLTYLLLAIGGALGTLGRFFLNGVVSNLMGPLFPWGTFVINVTGSFAISFFFTLTEPAEGRLLVGANGRQFFMTGICGGYTTFSSFTLQTLNLGRDGEWMRAGGNVVGSVTAGLAAAWLGYVSASWINHRKGI